MNFVKFPIFPDFNSIARELQCENVRPNRNFSNQLCILKNITFTTAIEKNGEEWRRKCNSNEWSWSTMINSLKFYTSPMLHICIKRCSSCWYLNLCIYTCLLSKYKLTYILGRLVSCGLYIVQCAVRHVPSTFVACVFVCNPSHLSQI